MAFGDKHVLACVPSGPLHSMWRTERELRPTSARGMVVSLVSCRLFRLWDRVLKG